MMNDGIVSLAAADAYKAKQAAYDEFNNIRSRMQELGAELQEGYAEIGAMQKLYEDVYAKSQVEWEAHKAILNEFDAKIFAVTEAVQEAKDLEEKFKILASEDGVSDEKAELYLEAAEFFRGKKISLADKKDALIIEKRSQERPDCTERDNLLDALKRKRAEHSRLTAEYRTLKEECDKERAKFEQAREEYQELLDFESFSVEEAKKAHREEILEKSQISKDFWPDAVVNEYNDGTVHIYYGADSNHAHGHLVFNSNNGKKPIYSREPRESTKL